MPSPIPSGALITFSGFPSSGKSTRAKQLQAYLTAKLGGESSGAKVVLINDESLHLSKAAYDDSKSEKPARATLFSAVTRTLGKDTIVIVDAMNYIKGSRYQMYCNAREFGVRTCTVYVAAPVPKCREFNALKPTSEQYSESTLEALFNRFEEPSSAARWDAPLFTIPFDDPSLELAEGEGSTGDAERIWTAITEGDVKPRNSATIATPIAQTSYLTHLDHLLTTFLTTLLSVQSLTPGGLTSPTTLSIPSSQSTITSTSTNASRSATTQTAGTIPVVITLRKPMTMGKGQRLKRDFTRMCSHNGREMRDGEILEGFANFLEGAA